MAAGVACSTRQPTCAATPAMTYWSVGNEPGSVSTTDRSGRSAAAACSDWCRRTLVESPTTTWPGAAPTRRPIASPTRVGASHQPCVFHEPIRSRPHCSRTTVSTASGTPTGRAPSELPSR